MPATPADSRKAGVTVFPKLRLILLTGVGLAVCFSAGCRTRAPSPPTASWPPAVGPTAPLMGPDGEPLRGRILFSRWDDAHEQKQLVVQDLETRAEQVVLVRNSDTRIDYVPSPAGSRLLVISWLYEQNWEERGEQATVLCLETRNFTELARLGPETDPRIPVWLDENRFAVLSAGSEAQVHEATTGRLLSSRRISMRQRPDVNEIVPGTKVHYEDYFAAVGLTSKVTEMEALIVATDSVVGLQRFRTNNIGIDMYTKGAGIVVTLSTGSTVIWYSLDTMQFPLHDSMQEFEYGTFVYSRSLELKPSPDGKSVAFFGLDDVSEVNPDTLAVGSLDAGTLEIQNRYVALNGLFADIHWDYVSDSFLFTSRDESHEFVLGLMSRSGGAPVYLGRGENGFFLPAVAANGSGQ